MLFTMSAPGGSGGWIVGAVIMAFVFAVVGHQLVTQHQNDAAVANGEAVVAKVRRMDPGHCVVSSKGNKCLQLGLEMHPQGRAVYTTTLTHDIPLEFMSRVQPGSWLTVAVDRADSSKAYFDEASMAVEAPRPVVP